MMAAALAQKIPLFLKFSTFHVYGATGGGAISENFSPAPSSVYGLTNLMGDEAALYFRKAKGLKVIIPRLSNGYGAPLFREIDRWTLIVNDLARMAFETKGVKLQGSGLAQRDFVAIRDVYRAARLLSTQASDDAVVNVGGEGSVSMIEVARRVKSVHDRRYGTDLPLTAALAAPGETSQPVRYDIARLKRLGFVPADIMEKEIDAVFSLLEGNRHVV
jgi:UDP-glucose 4-epimerase